LAPSIAALISLSCGAETQGQRLGPGSGPLAGEQNPVISGFTTKSVPLGLTTKLVRIRLNDGTRAAPASLEIALRLAFSRRGQAFQRKRRAYVAGVYHYAPRRRGSVTDPRDRVC